MEQWLGITLVAIALVGGFGLGILIEGRVKRAMLRAAGGRVWRAVLAVLAYYLVIVVVASVIGLIAMGFHRSDAVGATVVVMAMGLLVIVPFCYVFMPQASEFTPTLPPSERADLRRLGADRRVAAAITWPPWPCPSCRAC